jgi:hydroxyethylthiazole kinase-like sugar kinase family protein
MISSVLDSFPQIQGPQKEQIKNQFIQSFGAKAIKGNIEMSTAVFPEIAVSKNEKWTISTTLESAMTARISTVYQLTDVTATSYVIHGDARVVTDPNDNYKEVNGMPMKYNMTGTMISDIKADKITGWISESKTKQMISGTVEIKDNTKVPGGITFPMSVVNESVTTDK